LAAPWMMEMAHRNIKASDLVLPFGLYRQVVVPLSDPCAIT
jgi:hypothetical protein